MGIVALVLATVDPGELGRRLKGADPGLLALAALAYVPPWALRGWRWSRLAGDLGDPLPVGPAVAMATVGNMLNLVLPAKAGDLLWANAASQRWGLPFGRAVVGVLAGRVLDLVVLLGLGVLSLTLIPAARASVGFAPLVGVGLALALAGGVGLAALRRGWVRALLRGPLRRLQGPHDALVEPLDRLTRRPGALLVHGASTTLIWLNEAAVAWMVARALGVEASLAAVLFALMVANLSKIVPLTPASMGTYEAAGALAYALTGLAYSAGFAVSLVEHVLKNGVNLALGALALAVAEVPVYEVDRARLAEAWRRFKGGPSA